jgi:hypothetical protein
MKKMFPCALLAFVLTGTQSQALSLETEITIGNFSSAMRKMKPNISDNDIYSEYYKVDGTYKTWKDLLQSMNPRNDKQKIANLSSAIDKVSWTEAASANMLDGAKYNALKLKAKFSK